MLTRALLTELATTQPLVDRQAAAEQRRARLGREVDAILITDPDNLLWLTGAWEAKPEKWLLYAGGVWHTILRAPHRETVPRSRSELNTDRSLLWTTVAEICRSSPASSPLPVDRGRRWANLRAAETPYPLADGRLVLSELRQYKDAAEIAIMTQNAGIVRDVLAATRHQLRPGMSEFEIWSIVVSELRSREPTSLQIYGNCASGSRTLEADPHASPRILQESEPLLLDVYPRIDGYFADLTETWCCGTMTLKMERMIYAVRETLAATAAMIAPGVQAIEVDREARAMLAKQGYPEAYAHHTGHGLGVKQQERPWLRRRSADVIREGMIIALEPACYVHGVGGVRLEDEFLVTSTGARSLTALAHVDLPPETSSSPEESRRNDGGS